MTPDRDRAPDPAWLAERAASVTEADVATVAEREAELRARFEKPGPIGRILSDVNLLLDLVRDYSDGTYRQVPYWAVAAVAFCFLYVLSPIDLVPDWLIGVGQIDDAILIGICLVLVEQELHEYKEWRMEQVRGDTGD